MTLYSYTVAADTGFAPNPFHGFCTLACCKPGIRRTAQEVTSKRGERRPLATTSTARAMEENGYILRTPRLIPIPASERGPR